MMSALVQARRARTAATGAASQRRTRAILTTLLNVPSLRLCWCVGRRSRLSRSEEQRAPIREREIAAVGAQRPVLRLIAVDVDLGSRLQGRLREASPQQRVW